MQQKHSHGHKTWCLQKLLFAKRNLCSCSCHAISFQNPFNPQHILSQLPGLYPLHAESIQKRIKVSPRTSKQATWQSRSNTNQPNYAVWFQNVNATSHSIVSFLSVQLWKRARSWNWSESKQYLRALSLSMDLQSLVSGQQCQLFPPLNWSCSLFFKLS